MKLPVPTRPLLAAFVAITAALAFSGPAAAQQVNIDFGNDDVFTGRVVQIIALVTVLSLAPSILVVMTSFTRIVVVLSLLRNAIGVQQTPPNTVLIGLALFLTSYIMAPTFEAAYNDGIRPLIDQEISEQDAFERTMRPVHAFMLRTVRERDLLLFMDLSQAATPPTPEETPLRALVPAFMISELSRAFEIGFLLFIPFLVIDMVVASVLMSMGMMMLPPIMVSLPFKIIFFVLVDGWHLVTSSVVRSFG
jgi:flagellar biosynthetic protein FliP